MRQPMPQTRPAAAPPASGPRARIRPRSRDRWARRLRRAAWGLAQVPLFYLLLCGFAALCLAWSLPASLLAPLLPARLGRPLGQRAISSCFHLFVQALRGCGLLRCDLSALDRLRQEPGLVIAANHPSLLDAVLLTSRLPRAVCIAKTSIWDNPLLGGGVRLAGYIHNTAPLPMIRAAAEAVRAGRQVVIFPEGTRSPLPVAGREQLGPFRRSFALMARHAGAPVQVVTIESDGPYLRKGWSPFRRPPLPLRYTVRLGQRFEPGAEAQQVSDQVERHLRQRLRCEAAGGDFATAPHQPDRRAG